jgi:hypothetical protein
VAVIAVLAGTAFASPDIGIRLNRAYPLTIVGPPRWWKWACGGCRVEAKPKPHGIIPGLLEGIQAIIVIRVRNKCDSTMNKQLEALKSIPGNSSEAKYRSSTMAPPFSPRELVWRD